MLALSPSPLRGLLQGEVTPSQADPRHLRDQRLQQRGRALAHAADGEAQAAAAALHDAIIGTVFVQGLRQHGPDLRREGKGEKRKRYARHRHASERKKAQIDPKNGREMPLGCWFWGV